MKFDIQRSPAGMFSIGNIRPESKNTRRNPPRATACMDAAWFGIVAPTIVPKEDTQKAYRIVAIKKGVGSPAKLSPKYVNNNKHITKHSARATAINAMIF